MPADQRCIAWAKGSYGAIDTPDEGLTAGLYENETSARHNNGAPMFAPDGTMLDETGKPSIFDATIRNDRP